VARHAAAFLDKNGFTVERLYAGTFLSSLDMAGISISVLGVNDEWLRWLDAPTTAPAWPNAAKQRPRSASLESVPRAGVKMSFTTRENAVSDLGNSVERAIKAACDALIEAEPELTELDRITGDGDLGASMKRASIAVKEAISAYPLNDISASLKALGHTLRHELGGSSGPLYGVLFLRAGNVLENSGPIDFTEWTTAFEEGCRAISELGGAKPGDRTMLDAFDPFLRTLREAGTRTPREVLVSAVAEARRGADATAQMKPRLGRSSYLQDRVLGHPDPGAIAVAIWLRAVVGALIGTPATVRSLSV
jgi:dihydroxyacetone kinase